MKVNGARSCPKAEEYRQDTCAHEACEVMNTDQMSGRYIDSFHRQQSQPGMYTAESHRCSF